MSAKQHDADAHPEMTGFRESRIYAEGWNAARGPLKSSLNPYSNEPERSRWLAGYTQGRA